MIDHLDELREAAKESGLSLYMIAKRCDLKCCTVAGFVRRRQSIRHSTALKIANLLGVEFVLRRRGTGEPLGIGHASATTAAPQGGA